MSKGGVSFTVGAKGYHLNFSKRGVRQTVGLPGSGISETSYLVKNDPKSETGKTTEEKKEDRDSEKATTHEEVEKPAARRRGSPAWLLLLGVVVIYFGALMLGLIPTNFLSQLLHTLLQWTQGLGL